ncbi:FecR family protein [Rufibacter quisquiliarum]|uniref:Ferric-dicitrate binding protein FerR (Iron transport regulator) n=1 Tax=Rufibacter quisquiliarum TaxID=1549639 RepID=A0A839GRN3_9BACT|nr:FecR family protein [Rufibacter quisquiliarum]MBA9077537.1 ferric-dicitrate binding protein FerR (iron transport regulator) [Rufibacter quisquiliarum]
MNQHLLDKFYQGECTPEEVKEVLAWFKSQEPSQEQEQHLAQEWEKAEQNKVEVDSLLDVDKTWRSVEASILSETESVGDEARVLPLRGTPWVKWMKVAASVLLPLGLLGLVALWYFNTTPAGKLMTMQTAPGERKTVQLEDGSTIILQSGSQVTYRQPFAADRRDITLEGEAFFQVAKDKRRPFVVKSGAIYTQALGTSFNIKYLPNDTATSVALATGLVKISQDQNHSRVQLAHLVPGEQLQFNRDNQQHRVSTFERREVLSWKDGVLYFKKASLGEVVQKIEQWYGVEVAVTGLKPEKMKEWSYTGEYTDQSLPQVLEGIGFVKQFSFKIQDNHVRLNFTAPMPMK